MRPFSIRREKIFIVFHDLNLGLDRLSIIVGLGRRLASLEVFKSKGLQCSGAVACRERGWCGENDVGFGGVRGVEIRLNIG